MFSQYEILINDSYCNNLKKFQKKLNIINMLFPDFKVLNLSILTPDRYGFSLGQNSVYF